MDKILIKSQLKTISKNKSLYFLLIPALLYFLVFKYIPMYGLIIAFKNVSPLAGFQEIFFGGTWAGLSNFQKFINSPYFWNVFSNTITISIYNLVVTFPTPIIVTVKQNSLLYGKQNSLLFLLNYRLTNISL